MHPKNERTFVILKPDAVQRSLVGEVISRFERTGLKFIAIKMFVPTREQLLAHYAKDDAWCEKVGQKTVDKITSENGTPAKTALEYGRDVLNQLVSFMSSGPVIAMALEGNQAVGIVKKLVGETEPLTSDVGTIRGDMTIDSYELANVDGRAVRNLIHCSDQVSEAQRELALWFKPEELMSYRHINEAMLYDINMDGTQE